MAGAASDDVVLSDLQIALMRVLWARGEASVADIAGVLADERGLKYTTVATLLTRLEKRGVVAQRRDGRQLIYRASVSEPQVRRSMVSDLIGSLFGGDPGALVAHLVDESEIAPGDLDRLRLRLARNTARRSKP
jgi:BlaI family penicillinase repressor